ncbi:hypothetical protein MPSEU_000378300 [Mayamaea pseudoterrestris]|nr:hypothetical protein MPSEU_000378300 [Mayamaea pseudoterrestris]
MRCQEEYACGSSESPHQANRSADVRNDSDVYLPLPDKESSHISVLNLSRISHDESQYTLSESPIDCVEEVSPGRCQIAYTPTRQSSSEFRSLQLPLFHEKENAALGMVYPLENSDIVSFSPISSPNRDHFTIGPGLWHHKPEPIVRDPCPHPQPTHTGMPLQDQQKVQLAPSSETKSDNMLVLTRTTSKHAITSYDIPSTFLSQTQVDRRRFRTVVPRRVFMNDPSDFLEYGDSFAPPTAGPSRLAHDTDISTLRK